MTQPWVGTSRTQIQRKSQPPRKLLLLPQFLHVVALVLRPTSCTLQLSMGPLVTYQPGEEHKSRRLGAPGGVCVWGALMF